jgi:hypothetical protein
LLLFQSYNRNSKQSFEVQKLECTSNPSIVTAVCFFQSMVNSTGDISIQLDYQRTVSAVTGEIRMYYKTPSAKRYKPTAQRQKMDYCFMTDNYNMPNLLTLFMPPSFEKLLPPCPLLGKYELNFTVPLVPIDPIFYRAGDYRLDVSFQTDDEVATWKLMGYISARA